MIDPVSASIGGFAAHSYATLPVAFIAGVATSFGPCVAPRYLALSILVGERRRMGPIGAFAAGLIVMYLALGAGAGLIAMLVERMTYVYDALAMTLIGSGLVTLLRESHQCADVTHHEAGSLGGSFSLGAASALVVSPCCTPVILAFAGIATLSRDPALVVCYITAFAMGHITPLVVLGSIGTSFAGSLRHVMTTSAPSVVSGSLAIALGCYYGLLA